MIKNIYLLRHFRVKDDQRGWLNGEEFDAWVDAYDEMELEYCNMHLPSMDVCFVSPQSRAVRSANYLGLEYSIESRLHEVEPKLFSQSRWRLSKGVWLGIGRFRWLLNLGKGETRCDSFGRVDEVIAMLQECEAKNILILSHGFFIKLIARELQKLGYEGELDIKPKNGKLYHLQYPSK